MDFKSQAKYYTSILLLNRDYVACVHLENEDDKQFWLPVLNKTKPGKYYIISSSKSKGGNSTSGCNQCLNYLPYLSNKFFIAIDSDLRHALEEKDIDASNHVAQTYTYSWENHYCEAKSLQESFDHAFSEQGRPEPFDFEKFIEKLSNLLYVPYLHAIENEMSGRKDISESVTKIFRCLPSQPRTEWLENNGEGLLDEIRKSLSKHGYSSYHEGLSAISEKLERLGITESNVYLHVRGHDIFNMIRQMGKFLCHGTPIKFTKDILIRDLPIAPNYWQLLRVYEDLSKILNT